MEIIHPLPCSSRLSVLEGKGGKFNHPLNIFFVERSYVNGPLSSPKVYYLNIPYSSFE
jgi:hypothetical protein